MNILQLNFLLSLLSVAVMTRKITHRWSVTVLLFFFKNWNTVKFWELSCDIQTASLMLPLHHYRMNSACVSSLPPKSVQIKPGPGQKTPCSLNLSNQITAFPLCFLPGKNQVSPTVTSLQAKTQPAVFLVCNLLSTFSHLPLIFDFPPPSAWLFSNPSSCFSLFSVSIPATFPTNSSQFLQYLVFIILCNHLILFFILWFTIQCLSLPDCLWWIQHGFDNFGGWCPIWKQTQGCEVTRKGETPFCIPY